MLFAPAVVALFVQATGQVRADAVTDWNVIAINATAVPPNAILQSRSRDRARSDLRRGAGGRPEGRLLRG
jgi:hypothetical protein